jgi:uncharacterized membrane protein
MMARRRSADHAGGHGLALLQPARHGPLLSQTLLFSLALSVAQLCKIVSVFVQPVTTRSRRESERQKPKIMACLEHGGSRIARDRRPDRLCCHGWLAAFEPSGSGGRAMTIRNPIEWATDQIKLAGWAVGSASRAGVVAEQDLEAALPEVRRIGVDDLKEALARGVDDFAAYRTDVIFLCVVYPVIGLLLARLAFGYGMLPLLFPLASGFALVGPFAALGLYEMSRRREYGDVAWPDAFGVIRSRSFGAIVVLGLLLVAIFLIWLVAAESIYEITLGPEPPASFGSFVRDVFTTSAGWAMIAVGMSVGFLFALLVLLISVVSFPLLLDRDVGLSAAVWTSVRAVTVNPIPMASWGLVVAAGLVVGSIPLFLGLIIVLPVLGHATWHLYRRVVPR